MNVSYAVSISFISTLRCLFFSGEDKILGVGRNGKRREYIYLEFQRVSAVDDEGSPAPLCPSKSFRAASEPCATRAEPDQAEPRLPLPPPLALSHRFPPLCGGGGFIISTVNKWLDWYVSLCEASPAARARFLAGSRDFEASGGLTKATRSFPFHGRSGTGLSANSSGLRS